jgi:hypothetical protein
VKTVVRKWNSEVEVLEELDLWMLEAIDAELA